MASSSNKIRVAVAGAGLVGRAHIAAALGSPTVELAAVVDPAAARTQAFSDEGVRTYPSLEMLIESDPPDGVVLATPNALHVEHALLCISAGLPILLEKPIAATVGDAAALVRAAENADARVLIGHHRAHSPIMAKAREVIDSGRLGRLVAVTGSATFMKPDQYFEDAPWRRQPGGGPILINLIHDVHNLRMLCGEIIAVQAFASQAVRRFPVEDTVAINLRFATGVLGTFILSDTAACPRSWEQTSRENDDYPTYPDEDCYVVAGTNGSLSIPTMRLKSYSRPEDRSWWKPFETEQVGMVRADPIERQMEHFGAVIRGEATPLVTARDGLRNLQVTEAIAEAARLGRTVELPADAGTTS